MAENVKLGVYRSNEKTPNGGAYSMAFFLNENGPCDKEEATRCYINEYDENGNLIYSTSSIRKKR